MPIRLSAAVPQSLRPLARLLWHPTYRAWVRGRCWWEDRRHKPGEAVPPAMLRFRVSGSTSLPEFLDVGRRTAENLEQVLSAAGCGGREFGAVLDFGCGCGRTLRWLPSRLARARVTGCDVDAEAIAWCRSHLPSLRFAVNSPDPPLPFADGEFDLVYAVSVFTHLDEAPQFAWLAELRRILRSGGIAVVTVHGEATWRDTDAARPTRENGFLFRRTPKLRGFCPDWYQTAYHTEQYVRREYGRYFRVLRYVPEGMGFQDAVVLEKPS